MSEEHREALWEAMKRVDGDAIELVVERVRLEKGASFSAEAMEKLYDEMIVWVGTRVMRRWGLTGEPPSALRIELKVTAA